MRAESARGDSASRAHVNQVLAQLTRANDSVRAISARLAKLQGDVANEHYRDGARDHPDAGALGPEQPPAAGAASVAGGAGAGRGATRARGQRARRRPRRVPAQLFQSSLDQLRRGSISVARGGFEELLRTYPTYEDAPEAMVYIAETYAAERNQVAADSVYGLVVQRYPRSPKAPTALYKRAQILRSAGQAAAARAALERIVREYPRSDEAALAREQLRTLGR